MTGGLFDPIGTDRNDPRPDPWRISAPVVTAALVAAAVATLLALSYLRDDGDRGLPTAVATIEHVQLPQKPPASAPVAATQAPRAAVAAPALPSVSAGLPPVRADQEVEIQNGVRVVRPRRDGPAQQGQTIRVPDAETAR